MRCLLAGGLLFVSVGAFAQASGAQFSGVVCGPSGLSGVSYVTEGGRQVDCGTDSAGNQLVLQVSTLAEDQPVDGGVQTGIDIGGAVLTVMAAAFAFRTLRRVLDSGGSEA